MFKISSRRELGTLAATNMFVWHVCMILAVKELSSGRAAILGYTMPIWSALIAIFVFAFIGQPWWPYLIASRVLLLPVMPMSCADILRRVGETRDPGALRLDVDGRLTDGGQVDAKQLRALLQRGGDRSTAGWVVDFPGLHAR